MRAIALVLLASAAWAQSPATIHLDPAPGTRYFACFDERGFLTASPKPCDWTPPPTTTTSSTTPPTTAPACKAPVIDLPPEGGSFTGTTTGASAYSGSCNTSNNSPEIVYRWTPARSGTATIETCDAVATTFDTVMYLKRGSCDAPEWLCNDDVQGCGTTTDVSNPHRGSRLSATVTAGETYYLFVDGFNGSKGTFHLTVKAP